MMRSNFTKKNSALKQAATASHKRWGIVASLFVMVLCVLGLMIHEYKNKVANTTLISGYISRFHTWLANHSHPHHTGLKKTNTVMTHKNNSQDESIHFEFYNALPKMNINADDSDLSAENDHELKPIAVNSVSSSRVKENLASELNENNKKSLIKVAKVNSENDDKNITHTPRTEKKTVATTGLFNSQIVDAHELEQDLSAQLHEHQYVIQLGNFKNLVAAETYRDTLANSGFKAAVVKSTHGTKIIYHVQLGPFSNQNQVKTAEKQLLKKGINGIVHKIEIG